eukprot:gene7024-4982_t
MLETTTLTISCSTCMLDHSAHPSSQLPHGRRDRHSLALSLPLFFFSSVIYYMYFFIFFYCS